MKELPRETMSSLQYAGIRDLFCYQYLGIIPDLYSYLNNQICINNGNIGVIGIQIDFYFRYYKEKQIAYVLYRLGFNRRDTITIIETIYYYFESHSSNFTLGMVFEFMDSIKDKIIKKERDKCLFQKILLLLEINKKLKRLKESENFQK